MPSDTERMAAAAAWATMSPPYALGHGQGWVVAVKARSKTSGVASASG